MREAIVIKDFLSVVKNSLKLSNGLHAPLRLRPKDNTHLIGAVVSRMLFFLEYNSNQNAAKDDSQISWNGSWVQCCLFRKVVRKAAITIALIVKSTQPSPAPSAPCMLCLGMQTVCQTQQI